MMLPLSQGEWNLDPVHSVVQFSVRHLGISSIKGRFGEVSAALDVGSDLDSSALSAKIGMGSISTGNSDRDGHVQSSDIFDAASNPEMSFSSTSISGGDDGTYSVTGDLSLNGVTKSETLAVRFYGTEDNPLDGSLRAGFSATGKIDRTEYGVDWNVPLNSGGVMLGKEVDISIDAQLVGPASD